LWITFSAAGHRPISGKSFSSFQMIPLESGVEFCTGLWVTFPAVGHRPISGESFSSFQMIPVESGVEFYTGLWITSSVSGHRPISGKSFLITYLSKPCSKARGSLDAVGGISVAHPPSWALRHVVRPLVDAARISVMQKESSVRAPYPPYEISPEN
jgi:hypothetical protein